MHPLAWYVELTPQRPIRETPRTLTESSPPRHRQTRTSKGQCCRKRCSSSSPAGHTTDRSLDWVTREAVSWTIRSRMLQGKGKTEQRLQCHEQRWNMAKMCCVPLCCRGGCGRERVRSTGFAGRMKRDFVAGALGVPVRERKHAVLEGFIGVSFLTIFHGRMALHSGRFFSF